MNTSEYVEQRITELKNSGIPLSDAAFQAALLTVGWPYVFGDRGVYCTPTNRKAAYNRTAEGGNKDNIMKRCQVLNGSKGSCTGCKWLPEGKKVREFDCRGFTYWILLMIFGWKLMGAGCTSQWNDESNWKMKGELSESLPPENTIACVFWYKKDKNGKRTKTLEHTGLYYNGKTVECSNGVQYIDYLHKKWEVWAVPACVGETPGPTPPVPPTPPTPTGYAVVTGKKVALRQDPSLQATVITRVNTGETVKLEDLPAKEWDYVSYDRKTGWMKREFLREEGDHAIVTGKKVALRKDPSLRATCIMRINTNETVQLVTEPESQWSYISYKSNVGYMMKEYLKEG